MVVLGEDASEKGNSTHSRGSKARDHAVLATEPIAA